MKLPGRIIFLSLLIGMGFSAPLPGQTGSATFPLKEKLKRFEHQKGYLKDTAYIKTLISLANVYALSTPDSALSLLAGNAEQCQAAGYKEGEVNTFMIIGDAFQTKGNYNKALEHYEKSLLLAKKMYFKKSIPFILNRIGMIHLNQGNYPEALSKFYESLKAAETLNNKELIGATLNNVAIVHLQQGKLAEAEMDYKKLLKIAEETSDSISMSYAYNGIGEVKLQQKEPQKALNYFTIANDLAMRVNDQEMLLITTLSLAETYFETDSLDKAAVLFENSLRLSKQKDQSTSICNALIGLAKVRNKQGLLKLALANGLEGLQKAQKMGQVQLMRDASKIISAIYETLGEGINALKYYRVYKINSDSLNNLASQRAVAIEKASYEFSKKEIAFQRKTLQQQWIIISAFVALFSLSVIVWIIIRNKKRLNLTYKDLQHKNTEIAAQKLTAEETLSRLQAAQSQLIHAEKMASLGELTAGIAHEIQNPLNFVNNFSEVSNELIEEMNNELSKGNYEDANAIADDIKQNLEKIIHHGKRADAIVKGMLLHSRSSTGVKEPTEINALCDEYLRLSYHGLRAKDKSFNATIKTDFDESIGKINIIPQDVGRVILNLINNAFYATAEMKKITGDNYEPTVTITTSKIPILGGGGALISVRDNGPGIPQKIVDKIFQPFFTTKPTGQGTGLGLSLSYDIVKAHGGEIKVETKEGGGSEFVILLPNV